MPEGECAGPKNKNQGTMSRAVTLVKDFGSLLKKTFTQWNSRDPFTDSSTIAYYTIFSLPGLLVIIVNLAGYFFGTEAVTSSVSAQIQGIIGQGSAKDIENIIAKASESNGSTLASILSVATLLFGATAVFYQLQQTLNKIWGVKPKPKQKFLKLIKDRVFSFGLILVVGFLLLISLVLSAALAALSDWVSGNISEALLVVFKVLDIVVSLGIITLLFAAIYKFLPDAKVRWRDVWVGATVTAVLFVVAKFALGIYFGKTDQASVYGAAGSIVLIMLWVTYAGLILLFGAEFTQVYATRYGKPIEPTEGAESVKDETQKENKPNPAIDERKSRAREREQSTSPRISSRRR
jgi:membrane protein